MNGGDGEQPDLSSERSGLSGLLAAVSLLAGVSAATGVGELLAIPVAAGALAFSLKNSLNVDEDTPTLPPPALSWGWLEDFGRYIARILAWALPQVPFVAPLATFVAVTWPLAQHSASLQFQQQASNIIPVLLIGYVIEAGALRWRHKSVNWILSLLTVLILVGGETYALVDLATKESNHADIIAGSMAAGVVALLVAAVLGSAQSEAEKAASGADHR